MAASVLMCERNIEFRTITGRVVRLSVGDHRVRDFRARDGCTEAIMLAHGFTVPLMVDLCVAGLATATPERIVAGGRTLEVATMQITDAGRRALKTG